MRENVISLGLLLCTMVVWAVMFIACYAHDARGVV